MRVWLTSSNVTSWVPKDCQFTGCDSTSGNCVPDCGSDYRPEVDVFVRPIIGALASRRFLVTLTPDVLDLLELLSQEKVDPRKLTAELVYDDGRSTVDRAIWVSDRRRAGDQLRLEVTHGACCAQAQLIRTHLTRNSVGTVQRWWTACFDVLKGGRLDGLTADGQWRDGSVLLLPSADPDEKSQAAPVRIADDPPARGARRPRRGRA
jgi:hypothetical protein